MFSVGNGNLSLTEDLFLDFLLCVSLSMEVSSFFLFSRSPFFRRLGAFPLVGFTLKLSFKFISLVFSSLEADVGRIEETFVSKELASGSEDLTRTVDTSSAPVTGITVFSGGFSPVGCSTVSSIASVGAEVVKSKSSEDSVVLSALPGVFTTTFERFTRSSEDLSDVKVLAVLSEGVFIFDESVGECVISVMRCLVF